MPENKTSAAARGAPCRRKLSFPASQVLKNNGRI